MQVGDIVDGRYRLLDVLGEGAAGKVFRCEDLGRGNKLLALKMLHAKDPRWENFFRREFEVLSRLHHPNLVHVHDFGPAPDDKSWYFTQELVIGKPMLEACAGKKFDEVLGLFVEVCRALEFIHGHGVLHRDLKPANILVQQHAAPGERVRVLDFGLWRELDPTPQKGARWAGTPPYLASEVLRGFGHSISADLYAVGVTLFQVLTRRLPHGRGTPQELLVARKTPAQYLYPSPYVLPGPSGQLLADLIVRLLDEEPARRPQTAAEVASALSQLIPNQAASLPLMLGRARLVGRDAERERVTRSLELVAQRAPDAPRLIVVEGKDGVGKSRLVAELKADVQLKGGRAAIGLCMEDARWAYRPIADLVRSLAPLARKGGLRDDEQRIVAMLCPELVEGGSQGIDPSRLSRTDRERFHQSVVQFFLGLGTKEQATVLVVEDIPWADAASVQLLASLLKKAGGEGLVVIVTTSEQQGPVPRELVDAAGGIERHELLGLQREDVRKLLAALLGIAEAARVPDALVDLLVAHSGGNPLLIEELLALMIERQDIKRGDHGWLLDDFHSPVAATPSSQVLEQRLARLGRIEKDTLRALAVFNRPSGAKLLAAIAGLDVEQVRQALSVVEGQGLIRVVDTEEGRPRVVFRHPHIRDALLRALRASNELARWHKTCAAVLEERARDNLAPVAETLGVHLERAGETSRAVKFFLMGAEHAIQTFAFDDALLLGRRAARLAQQASAAGIASSGASGSSSRSAGLEGDLVVRTDLVVGKALVLTGQLREARAFLESAITRPEAVRAPGAFGEMHVWLSRACRQLGAGEASVGVIDKALADLGQRDALATVRLLIARGELRQRSRPELAIADARRALTLLEGARVKRADDELAALDLLAHAATQAGRHDEAIEVARKRLQIVERDKRRVDEIPARRALAEALAATGDRLGARDLLNGALKLARETGHRVEEALLQKLLGDQLRISGAYSEAIARYQNAASLSAEVGQELDRAECLRHIGRCYAARGDFERAHDHLRASIEALDKGGEAGAAVEARCDLVAAMIARAAIDDADEMLAQASTRMPARAQHRTAGALAHATGLVAMARNDTLAARRAFLDAAMRMRAAHDRVGLGSVVVDYAQLLVRSGSPARALRMARRAEWIFTDFDARGELKRIQPLLNAAKGLARRA